MLKKKIASVIAALATTATMGATALSASAACIHYSDNTCYAHGTFYQWVDTNENGEYDAGEETSSFHMLESLINGNPVYDPDTGKIAVTLQSIQVGDYTGYISGVSYYEGDPINIASGVWSLTPATGYTVSISVSGYQHPDKNIVFLIDGPCGGGCGCGGNGCN